MRKFFKEGYYKKEAKFITIALILMVSTLVAAFTAPDIDVQASNMTAPQGLIVNIGSDASNLNFNWYCDSTVSGTPSVKIAGVEKAFVGTQVTADDGIKYNQVTVTGLEPGTTYECQVSSDGINYSQTYTFKTSGLESFTFAAIGDPQIGASSLINDSEKWAATVGEILSKGAYFIAGTGDQVNDYGKTAANEAILKKEYNNFIAGLVHETQLMPFSVVIGNHEGYRPSGIGREMFNYYYNIANKSEDIVLYGFNLTNYYYIYNNTLFVVLDTAPYPDPVDTTFAKSLIDSYDKVLTTATATYADEYDWLVVQTHKSEQCNPANYNVDDIKVYSQAGFEDLMTKYEVDLVLAGHTHSYIRTYPFKSNAATVGTGGPTVKDGITIDCDDINDKLLNPDGTIYMILNSASGSIFYDIQSTPKLTSKVEKQTNIPQYTIINVTAEKLTVITYEVGSTAPIDSFTITKTDNINSKSYTVENNTVENNTVENITEENNTVENITTENITEENNNLKTKNKPNITIIVIIATHIAIITMIIVIKRIRIAK